MCDAEKVIFDLFIQTKRAELNWISYFLAYPCVRNGISHGDTEQSRQILTTNVGKHKNISQMKMENFYRRIWLNGPLYGPSERLYFYNNSMVLLFNLFDQMQFNTNISATTGSNEIENKWRNGTKSGSKAQRTMPIKRQSII